MTTPISNIDNTTLLALTVNLDIGDIADPALRLAYFQYLNVYIQTITTAFNAFVANGAVGTVNLADLSVTTGKLALLAVTSAQIALLAVGTAQLADGAVTNPKVATGIDAVKIGGGLVDNTEFSYLNGVTSLIQAQLDAKQALDSTLTALAAFNTNGLMKQTGADTFTAVAAPIGTVVGTTDAQTLTNKIIDAIQLIGTINVARIPTAIPATSIGNGDVTNAILSFISTLSSNAQAQLDAKAPLTHVGQGDSAHAIGTSSAAGFISAAKTIQYDALVPSGLASYSIPVSQIFSRWGRYSEEQDPVTGEWVFYEI